MLLASNDLAWINEPLEILETSLQVLLMQRVYTPPKGFILPGSHLCIGLI